jgi:hypothetical protein
VKLYANHSARVAAEAFFIFFDINERYFYLDRDMVLDKAGILPGGDLRHDVRSTLRGGLRIRPAP